MKNILIMNLGSSHDVISSSHLINSYKNEYPQSTIELLVYKENSEIASLINNVSQIHSIDRELIQKLSTNPLYSDAYALNSYADSLESIKVTNWDNIINYSNDDVSAYLMLGLNSIERTGTYINTSGVAKTTDKWSNYQNFVASKMKRHTINRSALRCHMTKIPLYKDIEKLKIDPDYSVVAAQNFSKVRQMKGSPATFIVGINLEVSYDGYSLDYDTCVDLIEAIEESSDYKAVLLLNGKNYQRKLANDLNQKFDNKLISINVDTPAITSVIPNLDAIISTSSDQLLIADVMEVKCIEVRENSNKVRSPIVTNSENYVIYKEDAHALSSDIILALNEEFGTELPISTLNSVNPTFKIIEDNYGVLATQIRGSLDIKSELRYHLERSVHLQMMGYPKNEELISHIKENTDSTQLTEFISSLKSELTGTVKILLATLRSLKGVRGSKSNLENFITYLDTLIMSGREDTFIGSLIRNFEGQIENIDSEDIDSNMKMIENHLFELKNNCQLITNIMTEVITDSPSIGSRVKRNDVNQSLES
jgi:ADP-heptose:LPS heptosyltransferase